MPPWGKDYVSSSHSCRRRKYGTRGLAFTFVLLLLSLLLSSSESVESSSSEELEVESLDLSDGVGVVSNKICGNFVSPFGANLKVFGSKLCRDKYRESCMIQISILGFSPNAKILNLMDFLRSSSRFSSNRSFDGPGAGGAIWRRSHFSREAAFSEPTSLLENPLHGHVNRLEQHSQYQKYFFGFRFLALSTSFIQLQK